MFPELRVICARLAGNELVAAECANLAGGLPDDEGVAVCQTLEHVWRAAYLRLGVRCLAEAQTLDELAQQVTMLPLEAESFRVEFLSLVPRQPVSNRAAVLAVADALQAHPDLEAPRHRFLVVAGAHRLWVGEILAEPQHSYRQHDSKPYRTSSSLTARLARALVNLVSPPARTILDPFCGTSSILLEAAAVLGETPGGAVYGADWNPKMVGMSRRNLAHFGYAVQVDRSNALQVEQHVDAIVTDLPYGLMLKEMDWSGLPALLAHLRTLAPRAVYLAGQDLTTWLQRAGYSQVRVLQVRKRKGLSRFVHMVEAE